MNLGYSKWAYPSDWHELLRSQEPDIFIRGLTATICPVEELANYTVTGRGNADQATGAAKQKFPEELVNTVSGSHA